MPSPDDPLNDIPLAHRRPRRNVAIQTRAEHDPLDDVPLARRKQRRVTASKKTTAAGHRKKKPEKPSAHPQSKTRKSHDEKAQKARTTQRQPASKRSRTKVPKPTGLNLLPDDILRVIGQRVVDPLNRARLRSTSRTWATLIQEKYGQAGPLWDTVLRPLLSSVLSSSVSPWLTLRVGKMGMRGGWQGSWDPGAYDIVFKEEFHITFGKRYPAGYHALASYDRGSHTFKWIDRYATARKRSRWGHVDKRAKTIPELIKGLEKAWNTPITLMENSTFARRDTSWPKQGRVLKSMLDLVHAMITASQHMDVKIRLDISRRTLESLDPDLRDNVNKYLEVRAT